ncbi:MAG TPA: ABC transporter permease [Bacillota bacterium]|nr:ABC transporter permease [Bacillota bacterium]HQE66080.1 ABC transporter permease [Bacillota bacterium]HQJ37555.1 ABC transporter permease [Bacillota bacterium]HQL36421.1 ABC transporter permease [Bacillota bacterium]HRS22278.1 ABC transporter permease [Clostridia bacterium]
MYEGYSNEHKEFIRKERITKNAVTISRIIILTAIFALWEIAANMKWIDPFIMSQPSRIVNTIMNLSKDGSLFLHTGVTIYETIIGFISGTVLGTLVAIVLWWSNFTARVLDPYLVVLNALPKTALGPIILVWIGGTTGSIIVMALLLSIIVTILNVYQSFKSCDEDKIKLLKTFGATKVQILRKVVFPSSIPEIISTLKINVGLSLVGVIVGEFLVSKAGLGYLIIYGGQVFKMDLVMTSVIILAVAAAFMYLSVTWIEKKFVKMR